jgi:hypothetical protein
MIALQAVELDVLDVERLAVYPGPVDQLDINCVEIFVIWIRGHMRSDVDHFTAVHLAFAGILAPGRVN